MALAICCCPRWKSFCFHGYVRVCATTLSLDAVSQGVFITSTAFANSSLVLEAKSHWRSRHVVGRMLGIVEGMRCVAG
jgi:hypothetical protein